MTPTPEQFAALVQAYGNAVLNMAWENESLTKKKAAMGRADAAKALVLDAYAQALAGGAVKVPTLADVQGAVARGWCTPRNGHKEMDVELALDIAAEVLRLNHPPAEAATDEAEILALYRRWVGTGDTLYGQRAFVAGYRAALSGRNEGSV